MHGLSVRRRWRVRRLVVGGKAIRRRELARTPAYVGAARSFDLCSCSAGAEALNRNAWLAVVFAHSISGQALLHVSPGFSEFEVREGH